MRALLLTCGVLATVGGCTPWEGTWLFEVDRNTRYEDDCEGGADEDEVEYTGGDQRLVDIYPTSGGGLVVLWDQPLSGFGSASGLEVGWQAEAERDGYRQVDRIVLDGTLEAGILAGAVANETWEEFDGGGDYHCVATASYTAQRMDASRNQHVE